MEIYSENSKRHSQKLYRSIQNKLFDLLIDLDEENNYTYNHKELNLVLKYYILHKIFLDLHGEPIIINEMNNVKKLDFTLGKSDNNEIKILEVDKLVVNNNNYEIRKLKDYNIRGNNFNKINKKYKLNYYALYQHIKSNKNIVNIKISNSSNNNNNNLNDKNNINKFKNLIISNCININSKYFKEFDAHNVNNNIIKINNPYFNINEIPNDIDNNLIGDKTINHRDKTRDKYNNKYITKLNMLFDDNSDSDNEYNNYKFHEFINNNYDKTNKRLNQINNDINEIIIHSHENSLNNNKTPEIQYNNNSSNPTPYPKITKKQIKQEQRDINKAKMLSFLDQTKKITIDDL